MIRFNTSSSFGRIGCTLCCTLPCTTSSLDSTISARKFVSSDDFTLVSNPKTSALVAIFIPCSFIEILAVSTLSYAKNIPMTKSCPAIRRKNSRSSDCGRRNQRIGMHCYSLNRMPLFASNQFELAIASW